MKKIKGFTLIEMVIVLSLIIPVIFMYINSIDFGNSIFRYSIISDNFNLYANHFLTFLSNDLIDCDVYTLHNSSSISIFNKSKNLSIKYYLSDDKLIREILESHKIQVIAKNVYELKFIEDDKVKGKGIWVKIGFRKHFLTKNKQINYITFIKRGV